ncbi:MAG: urate hydroxylase PuuD [Deltaproteobacteria bacterium]|nr:MAG: urate hydroxylase PuuD [Deltaproteobacteria bacterium]
MMDALPEWSNLLIRWFHVFAGILWIGSTWYFTWLDRQLHAAPEGVWMVHSGGFYLVEKQQDPKVDPSKIHWFRYEALFTWLSGLVLLYLVYYSGGLMEDAPRWLGAGLIVVGWGAVVSYAALVAVAWWLTRAMEGRAAYIHLGAMMGTIMALNVWLRILPAQRKLVAAIAAGQPPNPVLAERAKDRSKHNTFIILPVVMTMISNHFPTATYGSAYNWQVFAVLVLVGWGAAKIVRER